MPAGTILITDDDAGIRTVLSQALGRVGYEVRTTATASALWHWIAAGDGNLIITDVLLPDEDGFDLIPRIKRVRPNLSIIVMSARNTILTAITAAERGAFEYLPKPFDLKELTAVVQRALASRPEKRAAAVEQGLDERLPLIGRSPAMQEVYRVIARLTQTELTVILTGESGTGKELVARALHDYGRRRHGPFVPINMAAIPKELVESELFGHERGAFTGATGRVIGRFEQAGGGTLFLDEIGDMPLEAQTRLLRVLQQGEYTTVGGRTAVKTRVRVIAATNCDLRHLLGHGLFREDLYYRLNVVSLRLRPLRERLDDIADLVSHFLRRTPGQNLSAKGVEPAALERLKQYRWPGNVRELENMLLRIAALHAGDYISVGDVSAELSASVWPHNTAPSHHEESIGGAVERHMARYFSDHRRALPPTGLYDRILREVERPLLSVCLAAAGGNQVRAARLLGPNGNTLRKKMRDLGVGTVKGPNSQ